MNMIEYTTKWAEDMNYEFHRDNMSARFWIQWISKENISWSWGFSNEEKI